MNRLRILALCLQALTALMGLALFVMTIFIMAYPSSVMRTLETETVIAISAFCCGLSILIMVVAGVGFFGAQTESASILKLFVGLVIVTLIIEISAVVTPFGMRRRWEDKFNDQIFIIMDKYGQDEFPYLTQMWDDFQTKWRCCGSYKAEDWSFSAYVQQEYYPVMIPPSCCKSFTNENGVRSRCVQRMEPDLYYSKGCLQVTKEVIWMYMSVVGGLSSFIAFFQIVELVISFLLIKEYAGYEDHQGDKYEMAPPSSAVVQFQPVPTVDRSLIPRHVSPEKEASEMSDDRAEIDI